MQPYNTPVSQVRALEGKDLKELLELYKEPENSGYDLFAIISAISKKQNQIEVGKAHERQMAMAQGQQQLQQPPVSDQLEAQAQQTVAQERGVPSVMAAHGGVMHTYNNGGIVALRNGGATQYFSNGAPEFGIQSPEDYALDTLRVEEAQKAKRIKELESQLAFLEQVGAPQAADVRRELQLLKGSISPPSTAPTPTPTPRQDTAAKSTCTSLQSFIRFSIACTCSYVEHAYPSGNGAEYARFVRGAAR